jgi:hypothetical protein
MKKLTLALAVSLASLTLSEANIGETMKEVLGHSHRWKPIQFHDCPALQYTSPTSGNITVIFSPKTNLEIAAINDSLKAQAADHVANPRNYYGEWKLVQDDSKMASWHLKHPKLGDLWMVVTAKAHVVIIATPEGLEALGLHATKLPTRNSN